MAVAPRRLPFIGDPGFYRGPVNPPNTDPGFFVGPTNPPNTDPGFYKEFPQQELPSLPDQPQQPQQAPQQPQQGFMGLNLHDPMHLAILLSPLAEVLRHGAGAAIYQAALGGIQQREAGQERQREFNARLDEIRQRNSDAAANRAAQGEARTQAGQIHQSQLLESYLKLKADPRTAHLADAMLPQMRAAGVQVPELPTAPAAPAPLTFGQVHPGFKGTVLENQPAPRNAHGEIDYPSVDAAARMHGIQTTAPEAAESPQKRLDRLRVELPKLVASGDPAAEARIRQIAPILGLDPAASVAELQRNVGEKTLKTKTETTNIAHTQAEIGRIGVLNAKDKEAQAGTEKLTPKEKAAYNEYRRIEADQAALQRQAAAILITPEQSAAVTAKANSKQNRLDAILKNYPNIAGPLGLETPQGPSPAEPSKQTRQGSTVPPAQVGAKGATPVPTQPQAAIPDARDAENRYRQAGYVPKAIWQGMSPQTQAHLKRAFPNLSIR